MTRRAPRIAVTALAAATLAAGLVPAHADVPWEPPTIERIIGGPSRPGIAAWGLAYNPVSGELVVGDYVSNQVRRYSTDGDWLGDFTNPRGSVGGVGSALAVDPRDGAVYLAVTGDGKASRDVRKYDANSTFLYDFDLPGSITWLTVDDDGYLWAPEAFGGARIQKWSVSDDTRTATSVLSMGQGGTGPGQLGRLNGIDVDGAGNAYIVDAGNGTVHVFGPDGAWRFDMGDKDLFPGDMRGIAVDDGADRVYVANSQAGTIEVFDTEGGHLSTFASLGTGPGQFRDGARQLAITPDGHLWAADYASRRVQEFSAEGTFLLDFPRPPQLPDPAGFASARGVAVDPVTGDVLVADNWNQRVYRFAPDGTPLRTFGQRGSFPRDGMNYPRSIAVDPATRNVWVANYEGNPDLVVYTPDFDRVVRVIHVPRFVNDMDIVDGLAYLLVRRTGSVMVYDTATGALVRTCCTSLGFLRGIAVDTATGNMWLTSDAAAQVHVVSSGGSLVQTIPVDGRAWGATIVGDVVYVADSKANTIIAFDRLTYARLGAFGTKGFLPGQLAGPSGITSDATGRLYVVEDDGARVDIFAPGPPPAPESVKPTVTMDIVAPGAPAPLVLTGSATDASGVLQVEVLVQDTVTGHSWNARTGTWGPYRWNHAVVWGPASNVTWRFTATTALPERTYTVKARAYDAVGLISKGVVRTVTVGP